MASEQILDQNPQTAAFDLILDFRISQTSLTERTIV
jgi:hypothetical protein